MTGRSAHPALALTLIVGCYLMIGVDSSIVNVALPSIGSDLGFSRTGLSWVLNAYLLALGGLLLLGGRAGDVFGRRRVLTTGVVLFTGASALAAAASSPGWLIAARVVQGAGGALSTPSTLALLTVTFPDGPARQRALSLYSAAAGTGASLGLVIGGALTAVSWRWIFLITVPIGALIAVLAPRFIPEPERHPGRIDVTGAVLSTLGMTSLVYALIRASSDGWSDAASLSAFAAAAVLLTALVLAERRHPRPLIPLGLFFDRNRVFAFVNAAIVPAGMLGVFFFLTQYFQNVRGYSPLQAGLAFLPLTVPMLITVRLLPRVLPRIGPRTSMICGTLLFTTGAAWLTQLGSGSPYAAAVLVPLLLCGAGMGLSFLPLTLTVMATVERADSGAASGMLQSVQWIGSSLGLAVLTTVFAQGSGSAAALAAASQVEPAALMKGIDAAFAGGAAIAVASLLIAVFGFTLRRPMAAVPAALTQPPTPPAASAGSGRNVAR